MVWLIIQQQHNKNPSSCFILFLKTNADNADYHPCSRRKQNASPEQISVYTPLIYCIDNIAQKEGAFNFYVINNELFVITRYVMKTTSVYKQGLRLQRQSFSRHAFLQTRTILRSAYRPTIGTNYAKNCHLLDDS